jgi:hypothetical protein
MTCRNQERWWSLNALGIFRKQRSTQVVGLDACQVNWGKLNTCVNALRVRKETVMRLVLLDFKKWRTVIHVKRRVLKNIMSEQQMSD